MDLPSTVFYACGPNPLVEFAEHLVVQFGCDAGIELPAIKRHQQAEIVGVLLEKTQVGLGQAAQAPRGPLERPAAASQPSADLLRRRSPASWRVPGR